MLHGRDVVLRAWQVEDVPFFSALRNDLETQAALMGEPRPHTTDQTRQWLESRSQSPDGVFLVIAARPDKQPLGFAELRALRLTHRHASLGICLASQARGRGYAREALQLLERYGCQVWQLRKIVLHVLLSHTRAIRLYEAAGYGRVGVHQAHYYFDGTYHDVLVMEKLLGGEAGSPSVSDRNMPWMQ